GPANGVEITFTDHTATAASATPITARLRSSARARPGAFMPPSYACKGCPASPARLPGFILAAELIRPDGRCLAARAAATFELTTHRPEGTPRCFASNCPGR